MTPMLHHALPALEKMYRYWEKSATKPCYQAFILALNAGMMKLNDITNIVPIPTLISWQ